MVTFIPLAGCGGDLGDCEQRAAEEVVYSRDGFASTKGQALVHDTCGNGVFCHSSVAEGSARYGAPAHLNFDMLPVPTGWARLMNNREAAWDQVESGHMPPGDVGKNVVGDNGWSFASDHRDDAPTLPALANNEGKSAFRNWLACGAPLVSDTRVPDWVRAGRETSVSADFDSIYNSVLRPNCTTAGCHGASAAGELVMLDACSAYSALLQGGNCGGPRVVAGDTDSLLLDKLQTRTPRCGAPMPPTGPLAADKVAAIRDWVSAGAKGPSCP